MTDAQGIGPTVEIPLKELEALDGLIRSRNELRAEVERKKVLNDRLVVELTHRVGWEERAMKAEAEVERLKILIVGLLHADEDAIEQARKLVG